MPYDQGIVDGCAVGRTGFIALGGEGHVPHSNDPIVGRAGRNGQEGTRLAVPHLRQQRCARFRLSTVTATCESVAAEKRSYQNDSHGQSEFLDCWFHVISF